MKKQFKPHLLKIERKRTSVGRDLENGLRLDRNERVTNFTNSIIKDIFKNMPNYSFNAYPDTDCLYKKLSDWIGISEDEIYITNGITEGIRIAFETLVYPNDKIVLISPTFPMYKIYADIYQAKNIPVGFLDDLSLDIDYLLDSIDNDTCLVCLPNPNLPIESFLSADQIKIIADKCNDCSAMLIVDEAYAFFGAESAIPLIKEYDNIIVFQTFSKAFGLAGIRLGYMVSNKENINYLTKTRSLVESNGITMAIAEYMLDHLEIKDLYVKELKEGRNYVKQKLKIMGYNFFGGDFSNGMLIFLNNKKETEDLLQTLRDKKIYLRGSFEDPINNCVRLTLGPKEIMEKFIMVFSEWNEKK